MNATPHLGHDPAGNARTVPVKVGGKHAGLVVWHSPEEYAALWRGVDREASAALARDEDSDCPAYEALGEAE